MKRRGVQLIGPINLDLGSQGLTIVLGPNGSGKTSLLRLMHGLERPASGTINWACPDNEARSHQAYVFQTPTMMRRSVTDSISYALIVMGVARPTAREKAKEYATRVGLGHLLDCPAGVLSGGEKQKLAMARALIRQPQVLFLDEPCANLDGRATKEIEVILNDVRQQGTRIVMATHDLGQAKRLADDLLFMLNGCVREQGAAESFFADPQTAEAKAFLNGQIVE
ncbi:energy-coupling factor ABC transporter ATP-binding protein [Yoonia sp. F2084L]|uniref:energy-coupling factor ABC transporter ATP-binding protein n=1 Tax=Yoonia sp. F2084L TaxID=2926419 RepID=UPI001FF18116|nr:energy-coupling factor ABC transporter ATP-binding protein [Yoonia sp. F2084L]